MVMLQNYWLIENQSRFTNESRNAMVLNYFFVYLVIYLVRSHSPDHARFSSYNEKSAVGWIQSIL